MMIRVFIFLMVMMFSSGVQAADLTGLSCEQEDVVLLRFNDDRAQKRKAKETFRIDMNKLFAKDLFDQSKEIPVEQVQATRYTAGSRTIIFNPDYTSADVAMVTMTDVQTARWRCKQDKK